MGGRGDGEMRFDSPNVTLSPLHPFTLSPYLPYSPTPLLPCSPPPHLPTSPNASPTPIKRHPRYPVSQVDSKMTLVTSRENRYNDGSYGS